jgi:hypothetical protein
MNVRKWREAVIEATAAHDPKAEEGELRHIAGAGCRNFSLIGDFYIEDGVSKSTAN